MEKTIVFLSVQKVIRFIRIFNKKKKKITHEMDS